MNVVTHRFASPKSNGPDATQVQASHWNDGHLFAGGAHGDVLTRDLGDPTFGATWTRAGYAYVSNVDTGTRHDWTPAGFGTRDTVIEWFGTADLSITGLATVGIQGQIVTIKNRVAQHLFIFPVWPESSAPARFYNAVQSGPTPLGIGGWASFVYLGGWIMIAHEQGAWITPPFNAADYIGAGGMTWTVAAGNVTQCGYRVSGNTLQWTMYLTNTTLAGTAAAALFRMVPGGYDPRNNAPVTASVFAGTQFAVVGLHEPSNRRIHLIRDLAQSQAYPLGAMTLYFSTVCEIV